MRTTLQIRKADEQIYSKLSQFNFSKFVSEMLQEHGQEWMNREINILTVASMEDK